MSEEPEARLVVVDGVVGTFVPGTEQLLIAEVLQRTNDGLVRDRKPGVFRGRTVRAFHAGGSQAALVSDSGHRLTVKQVDPSGSVSTTEAALLLGRSPRQVRRKCERDELVGAVPVGRSWQIPLGSVLAMIEERAT